MDQRRRGNHRREGDGFAAGERRIDGGREMDLRRLNGVRGNRIHRWIGWSTGGETKKQRQTEDAKTPRDTRARTNFDDCRKITFFVSAVIPISGICNDGECHVTNLSHSIDLDSKTGGNHIQFDLILLPCIIIAPGIY